jgi:hypothetical protein
MEIRVHELPRIGAWYWDVDHSVQFEIVATDKKGNIEIQYFEGEIEEIDSETWFSMHIRSIAPPADWTGPFEVEPADYHELKEDVQHPEDGHSPLDDVE